MMSEALMTALANLKSAADQMHAPLAVHEQLARDYELLKGCILKAGAVPEDGAGDVEMTGPSKRRRVVKGVGAAGA